MCLMMGSDQSDDDYGPKPTLDMNRDLFLPLVAGTRMFHHFGCNDRLLRDCLLHRGALAIVKKFSGKLAHVNTDHWTW